MKTAVQLTMFRVFNYGSALQAYALSSVIDSFPGWHCVTIDYIGQNGVGKGKNLLGRIRGFLTKLLYRRRSRLYNRFLDENLELVGPYASCEEMKRNPPVGDVYITGSDQTFNPAFSNADPAYFMEFAPNDKKVICYASSFAAACLDDVYKTVYRAGLSRFSALSTREESGVRLIKDLVGKEAAWCCDPTLLLTVEQWRAFAQKSCRRHPKKYVLVYLLAYMVNPFPGVDRLVVEVQELTGLEVVYLNGRKDDLFKANSRIVKNASPYEFVDLFLNAEFIITSSFHGTVFSLLSGRPFLACVSGRECSDSRIRSLLERVGGETNMVSVPISPAVHIESLERWAPAPNVMQKIAEFRAASLSWLSMAIGFEGDCK